MPWLVLAGSGGLANLVCDIVENVQSAPMPSTGGAEKEEGTPNMELRERLAEKLKIYFPSELEMDKQVDRVNVILFTRSYNIKILKLNCFFLLVVAWLVPERF